MKHAALAILPVLLAGCVTPTDGPTGSGSGPDDPTTDGTGMGPAPGGTDPGTGDASSGVAGACDLSTHRCVSPVPDGWSGPVAALRRGENDCSGNYDRPDLVTWEDVTGDPAQCSCECGAPSGGECEAYAEAPIYLVLDEPPYDANLDGCKHTEFTHVLDPAVTFGSFDGVDARFLVEPPAVETPGQCTPVDGTLTESFPELERSGTVERCAPSAEVEASCDDGSWCAPEPGAAFETALCIFAAGTQDCPSGTYSERHVSSAGVDDTRACGGCSCAPAQGERCDDAAVEVTLSGSPSGTTTLAADGECNLVDVSPNQGISGLEILSGEPIGGDCGAESAAAGVVVPTDPVTICCTPS